MYIYIYIYKHACTYVFMYVHTYICTLIYIYIYIYVRHLHGMISCHVCQVQYVLHKSLALSSRVYKYAQMYIQTACIDAYIHMCICLCLCLC